MSSQLTTNPDVIRYRKEVINMASLVFSLKDVPEQEANDIRQLLESNKIGFYETDEGRWRISVAAIWINNDNQYEQARGLINEYQNELNTQRQQEKMALQGSEINWWRFFMSHPAQVLIFFTAIIIVLAISTVPFFRFG